MKATMLFTWIRPLSLALAARAIVSTFGGEAVPGPVPPAAARSAAAPTPVAPEIFPWSEASPTARISKQLLTQIPVQAVTFTNINMMEYVLTDQVIAALQLTPAEASQISRLLAEALHRYRLEEAKHWTPTNAPAVLNLPRAGAAGPRRGPVGIEERYFVLTPFPEEAAAIRRELEAKVLATLGDERAKLFWLQGALYIDSEMRTVENPLPAGSARITTRTFMLQEANPGLQVYRMESTVTQRAGGGGGGGGGGGRPYTENLDQYAPDAMKPVLEEWRRRIAEAPPAPPVRMGPGASTALQARKDWEMTKWNDTSPFIEVPKAMLGEFRVAGLTPQEDISPEITGVLGLLEKERAAVRDLFGEFKGRMEQMEQSHFAQPDPSKLSFVLRSFPEESAALKRDWLERLTAVVGLTRAELLDRAVRIPAPSFPVGFRDGRLAAGFDPMAAALRGPVWLTRGTNELRIDLSFVPGANGTTSLQYEYQSMPVSGRGSGRGGVGEPPRQWWGSLIPPWALKPIDPPVAF